VDGSSELPSLSEIHRFGLTRLDYPQPSNRYCSYVEDKEGSCIIAILTLIIVLNWDLEWHCRFSICVEDVEVWSFFVH
jgi:hypothetical protein